MLPSCNLVMRYELNKKVAEHYVVFSKLYHSVYLGNQHGGREYDDLQNYLDMMSHETSYRDLFVCVTLEWFLLFGLPTRFANLGAENNKSPQMFSFT